MRRARGSVVELDRGLRYRIFWEDETGRRRSKTLRCGRAEADEALSDTLKRVDALIARPWQAAVLTLREAVEAWYLPHLAERRSARYADTMRSVCRKWLLPALGDVKLAELKRPDVQHAIDGMGLEAAHRSKIIVDWVLNHSLVSGIIDESPLAGVTIEMPEDTSERGCQDVLNLTQMAEVAELVRWSECEAAVLLQMHGGCRVGESLGVELASVSLVGRGVVVDICQAVDECGRIVGLKNRQSRRSVALAGPWAERLAELSEEARDRGQTYLSELEHRRGLPISKKTARDAWRRALEGSEYRWLPMRNLRNSYSTTRQWEMGMSEAAVAKSMGQLSVHVNREHYNRPDYVQLMRAAEEALRASGTTSHALQ